MADQLEPGVDTNPAHWWRTLLAGLLAIAVGCGDLAYFGRSHGLSIEIDELLILVGIGLVAGVPEIVIRQRGLPASSSSPPVPPPALPQQNITASFTPPEETSRG